MSSSGRRKNAAAHHNRPPGTPGQLTDSPQRLCPARPARSSREGPAGNARRSKSGHLSAAEDIKRSGAPGGCGPDLSRASHERARGVRRPGPVQRREPLAFSPLEGIAAPHAGDLVRQPHHCGGTGSVTQRRDVDHACAAPIQGQTPAAVHQRALTPSHRPGSAALSTACAAEPARPEHAPADTLGTQPPTPSPARLPKGHVPPRAPT